MTSTLWELVPDEWRECLSSCRREIDELSDLLLQSERSGVPCVPRHELIFASLEVAPQDVAVVILGQDPYPNPNFATGLAFAVPTDTNPIPGSLRNIFREVASDTGRESALDCTLDGWVEQGVLLLNTSLTTKLGERASHVNWPWQPVIKSILQQVVEMNPKVVAILWGNHSKQFAEIFDPSSVIESAHPSPLSASRGFFGSRPFSKTNQILSTNNRPVIRW
jgi:uracil-DNA glycosylase